MHQKTCGARNKHGQPCSRIPAPGFDRCYRHRDGSETLTDEELDCLIECYEDLTILTNTVDVPTPDQRRECERLWILAHAFETIARQRAGLRSICAVPCGLCAGLQDVFDATDRERAAAASAMVQKSMDPAKNAESECIDEEPEDVNDESVEIL